MGFCNGLLSIIDYLYNSIISEAKADKLLLIWEYPSLQGKKKRGKELMRKQKFPYYPKCYFLNSHY